MTTNRWAGIVGMVVLVAVPSRAAEDESARRAREAKAIHEAKIGLLQAAAIAEKQIPGGRVVEVKLRLREGRPVADVEVVDGNQAKEVKLDATSGAVTKVQVEPPCQTKKPLEQAAAMEKAKVTLTQAVEAALARHKGATAVKVEVEVRPDRFVYDVILLVGENSVKLKVDAITGQVHETGEKDKLAWTFDKDAVGKAPPGWLIRQNNPTKAMGRWTVEVDADAPSKPNVLRLATDNGNATFNLAIAEETWFRDVDLSVRIKAHTGGEDQGGGLMWRVRDENNYYVCRINPLEPNFRVYKVVDGKRQQIQSVAVKTEAGKWYTLRAVMAGDHITCWLDGEKKLDARDDTLKDAGMIGLWTKADASSSFDDVSVKAHEK